MTEIIIDISNKINRYKPSKLTFNELFDSKISYKVYLQYKKLFLTTVKEYYENIDLQDENVDLIKSVIDFNELKTMFLSKYYSNTLDWSVISKNYKIIFVDYVNCYELLKSDTYVEFKNYLIQFNITDVNEIINELQNI